MAVKNAQKSIVKVYALLSILICSRSLLLYYNEDAITVLSLFFKQRSGWTT